VPCLFAVRCQVLSAYTLMASKHRPDVEAAVGQLLDMANVDASNVPVLLGLAHGFLLLKQTAKARNQLKVCNHVHVAWCVAPQLERADGAVRKLTAFHV
jgi:tetratricopeptide repeat protein 21B